MDTEGVMGMDVEAITQILLDELTELGRIEWRINQLGQEIRKQITELRFQDAES